jgi:hypothetical protein
MLVISKQYEALLGAVENTGKGTVQTVFYHFMLLPIWPQGSYFVTREKGETTVQEVKRHRGSILAGYLVMWPLVIGFWTVAFAIVQAIIPEILIPIDDDPMLLEQPIVVWAFGAFGVLMALVGLLAWVLTRRPLGRVEKQQRLVFEELTGSRADLAQLPDPWSMRDDFKRAMRDVVERSGLRDGYEGWHAYALDPRFAHPAFLKLALAVARIYTGNPDDGVKRARVDPTARPPADCERNPEVARQLFDRIWERLVQVDPSLR